ncbi:MAG: capsular polysaccharide biosynthesis protein [Parvicella sp.]|jgi:capsular polysaccharide biosynthesis protein
MNEKKVNKELAVLIYKNRVKIIVSCLFFCLLSGVVTFFIPKKYSASGMVYPTASNDIKHESNDPNFGLEINADKLIQLFDSEYMFNHIVEKFDLVGYYEIDTSVGSSYNSLKSNYYRDISVERTKYLSLNVSAVMSNAEVAADIVNEMISYIDTVRSDLYLQNAVRLVEELDNKIGTQQIVVDSILQLIFDNNETGEVSPIGENRIAIITKEQNEGDWKNGNEIVKQALDHRFTPALEKEINSYYYELGILSNYKLYLAQAKEKVDLPFPNIYRISKAQVNNKKTSPSLLINLILGFGFGLVLSIGFILFRYKWKAFKLSVNQS